MVIKDYYRELKRIEKKHFRLLPLTATDLAESTLMYKIREDKFTKLEREAIEKIIQDLQQK